MPKYRGDEVAVVIATTEATLASNTEIPYVSRMEWRVDQGIHFTPKGLGYRTQEVRSGLYSVSGTIVRDYDETHVIGNEHFADSVQATNQGKLTPLWLQVRIKTTGEKFVFQGVMGNFAANSEQDGYVTETYDWSAEEMNRTT